MRKRLGNRRSQRKVMAESSEEAARIAEEARAEIALELEYDRQEERGIDRWRGLE